MVEDAFVAIRSIVCLSVCQPVCLSVCLSVCHLVSCACVKRYVDPLKTIFVLVIFQGAVHAFTFFEGISKKIQFFGCFVFAHTFYLPHPSSLSPPPCPLLVHPPLDFYALCCKRRN